MATKTDLDRLGLFKETNYITIGDSYKADRKFEFKTGVEKGRQLYSGPTHSKTALKQGYFEDFGRVFNGEAYDEPVKRARQNVIKSRKMKITTREFYPSSSTKKPSGLGSIYGLFNQQITHFVPNSNKIIKIEKIPNFKTNPAKKGTGYGYPDVTINKFPEYKGDKYDKTLEQMHFENENHRRNLGGRRAFLIGGNIEEFGPNPFKGEGFARVRAQQKSPGLKGPVFRPSHPPKISGGCHAGTLNPWPIHSTDKYIDPYKMDLKKTTLKAGIFNPSSFPKSTRTESIIEKNIIRSMNSTNFNKFSSTSVY